MEIATRRWVAAWVGVAGVGILNGALHRLYSGPLGELRAHQLSGATFVAMYALYLRAVSRRWQLRHARTAARVGVVWAAGAVAFDTLVGHYLAGDSWGDVTREYDLRRGRIWGLVVLAIAVGPVVATLAGRNGARCSVNAFRMAKSASGIRSRPHRVA
jgi:hypothetical protein